MPLLYTDNGKIHNSDHALFADKVTEARVKKSPWEVIDLLMEFWQKKYPDEVEHMKENVRQYRESLNDKEFGTTEKGKHFERRFTMSFPKTLLLLIRTQYSAQELPFDRNFTNKFLKKYSQFAVADKR